MCVYVARMYSCMCVNPRERVWVHAVTLPRAGWVGGRSGAYRGATRARRASRESAANRALLFFYRYNAAQREIFLIYDISCDSPFVNKRRNRSVLRSCAFYRAHTVSRSSLFLSLFSLSVSSSLTLSLFLSLSLSVAANSPARVRVIPVSF